MLVEFSVGNYRSFREIVTLSMEAEPRLSERDKSVNEANIASTPDGDLLRVAGIYGANASGKSNLVQALGEMRDFVLDSARGQAGDKLSFSSFRLDAETRKAPTHLEVIFLSEGAQYRYGFEASRERVEREWLFVRPQGEEEEALWFEREGQSYTTGGDWARDESLEQKTREEALHLSVAASFNQAQAMATVGWLRSLRVSSGLEIDALQDETLDLMESATLAESVRTLMSNLDLGIDDIEVRSSKGIDALFDLVAGSAGTSEPFRTKGMGGDVREIEVTTVSTLHSAGQESIRFDINDESDGTRKAFALAGPIVDTLQRGSVLVIDELCARLHTLLALQLMQLFQDPATNPHDAQLVFTSHDTHLLTRTLLRRDQFWFVEKSARTQSTDLYSLAEVRLSSGKKVRNDARYEADYLQGRYGAVPFFGNLKAVLGEALTPEEE